jgi:hypothetical protein
MDKTHQGLVQTLHRTNETLLVLVQTLHRMDKNHQGLAQTLHRMNETHQGLAQTLHRMEPTDVAVGERWMFGSDWKKLKEAFIPPMQHRDSSYQHHLRFLA